MSDVRDRTKWQQSSRPDDGIREGEVISEFYRIGLTLGEGSYGRVVSAYDIRKGKMVAVKVF